MKSAKTAGNDLKVGEFFVKIELDYQLLPQLMKKTESSKYMPKEAHIDISNLDLKQDCVGIGSYIKKRTMKNCYVNNTVCVKQQNVSLALYA